MRHIADWPRSPHLCVQKHKGDWWWMVYAPFRDAGSTAWWLVEHDTEPTHAQALALGLAALDTAHARSAR